MSQVRAWLADGVPETLGATLELVAGLHLLVERDDRLGGRGVDALLDQHLDPSLAKRCQQHVAELVPERRRARLKCTCAVAGEIVLDGEALVKVPTNAEADPLAARKG